MNVPLRRNQRRQEILFFFLTYLVRKKELYKVFRCLGKGRRNPRAKTAFEKEAGRSGPDGCTRGEVAVSPSLFLLFIFAYRGVTGSMESNPSYLLYSCIYAPYVSMVSIID